MKKNPTVNPKKMNVSLLLVLLSFPLNRSISALVAKIKNPMRETKNKKETSANKISPPRAVFLYFTTVVEGIGHL